MVVPGIILTGLGMQLFLQRKSYEEWKKVLPHLDPDSILFLSIPFLSFLLTPILFLCDYLDGRYYNKLQIIIQLTVMFLTTLYFLPLVRAVVHHLVYEFGILVNNRTHPPGDKPPELMSNGGRIHSGWLLVYCFSLFIFTTMFSRFVSGMVVSTVG